MLRRKFVSLVAVGVSGCATTEPDGGTQTPTTKKSGPNNESAATASFEVEVVAPEQVEIGEEFSINLKITNTGTDDGTFRTAVLAKTSESAFEELQTIEVDVPAGETVTREGTSATFRYMTTITYKLAATETTWSINFVSANKRFGESITTPDNVTCVAKEVDLKSTYTYTNYNGEQAEEAAGDGKQWAFLTFRAENTAGKPEFIPLESDISLLAGNSQYDTKYIRKEEGRYEGGEVQAGIVREGWLAYEIPAELSKDDLKVAYSETFVQGDFAVYWSSSAD